MAAKVTDRLWEMRDIVAVVEAWETKDAAELRGLSGKEAA
jgi:hypothetical protein